MNFVLSSDLKLYGPVVTAPLVWPRPLSCLVKVTVVDLEVGMSGAYPLPLLVSYKPTL